MRLISSLIDTQQQWPCLQKRQRLQVIHRYRLYWTHQMLKVIMTYFAIRLSWTATSTVYNFFNHLWRRWQARPVNKRTSLPRERGTVAGDPLLIRKRSDSQGSARLWGKGTEGSCRDPLLIEYDITHRKYVYIQGGLLESDITFRSSTFEDVWYETNRANDTKGPSDVSLRVQFISHRTSSEINEQ